MDNQNDFAEEYKRQQQQKREKEISENMDIIDSFIDFCKTKNVKLSVDNFDYIQTIGIVVIYPNILHLLNEKIILDKDGLVEVSILENEFQKQNFFSGYYFAENYMAMAHPYFRRGHYENSNYAPRFVEIFWQFNEDKTHKYIAVDSNRVRINVDGSMYMEFDTWYGAEFKNTISDIENGIVKLRPPLDLEPFQINFFFGSTHSLDIKWTSKYDIKTFQLEEFKTDSEKILLDGKEYFPVKYIHAEFDCKKDQFRHFDGAIHLYNEEDYYQRRDSDFNYNKKSDSQIKSVSQKLFKINGELSTENWIELTSHFLTGNPLIFEYFEGKLPDRIVEIVERLRSKKNEND